MTNENNIRSFKRKTIDRLNTIAYVIEIAVAGVLLAAVLVFLIELVIESKIFAFTGEHLDFNNFLAKAFTLSIGVEFTKMLCRHTADTVVDVLLFATARQIVVSHADIKSTLGGVIAIAILFAVKKYVLSKDKSKKEKTELDETCPEKVYKLNTG